MVTITEDRVRELLWSVSDPEIPVLSIMDMGIVRKVELADSHVLVTITPTYSGCPAMDEISSDIKKRLAEHDIDCKIISVLSPAWTTDWITQEGRKKLEDYGIAAPLDETADKKALLENERIVRCTNCGSTNTVMVSQFGSTACKALFKCQDCLEPFDYFKCL